MGKKTRIVLLSITAAIAVFTFVAMWTVRPDSQSSVLDAARERQNEPLLQVSEPLETDVATLSAEEEMAEKVAALLSSDEAFVSTLAEDIAGRISLDDYIPELTENVYNRISSQYDAIAAEIAAMVSGSLEDDVLAIYEKHKESVVTDVVLGILEEYDSLSDSEKSEILSLESQLLEIYAEYRDALVSDLALETLSSGLSADEIDALILNYYEREKSNIAADMGAALLAEYSSLDAATRAEVLGIEGIYAYYRAVLIHEILNEVPEVDVKQEAQRLYSSYRADIVSDLENAIIADYSSLTGDEKAALLDLPEHDIEEQAVALYEKYRDVIIADILSALQSEPVTASVEPEPVAEPEKPEPAPVEEPEPVVADEPIVRTYTYAGYTLVGTISTGSAVLEYPAVATDSDVNAFFALENEKYGLAEMGISYRINGNGSVTVTYPEAISKEDAATALDAFVADLIAYLTAPVEEPEPAAVEEPEPVVADEPIVRTYTYAGYTLVGTISTGSAVLEYPAVATDSDVNAFFALENEKYGLAEMGISYRINGNRSVTVTYPESISKEDAAASLDVFVADLIAYLTAPVEVAEPEEPEIVPAEKVKLGAPSFAEGGIIDPNASAEEYERARTELRRSEIEKALEFIAE